MKRRFGKLIGLVAAGAVLLQAGGCSYIFESIFYQMVTTLVSQALAGLTT